MKRLSSVRQFTPPRDKRRPKREANRQMVDILTGVLTGVFAGGLPAVEPAWRSPLPEAAFEPAAAAGSTTWSISSTGSRQKPATRGKAGLPIA
jgi:hypothetical protein